MDESETLNFFLLALCMELSHLHPLQMLSVFRTDKGTAGVCSIDVQPYSFLLAWLKTIHDNFFTLFRINTQPNRIIATYFETLP